MAYAYRPDANCRTNGSFALRLDFSAMSRLVAFSFLAFYFHSPTEMVGKVDAYNVVRVCQNKHCCRRADNGDVLQTMNNLVGTSDDFVVEASGCLSECDKGPNVELTIGNDKVLLHEMVDTQTCAFKLGEVSTSKPSFLPVPKILVAASKVIEQSQQFSASGQFEEEIRFLTSVIDKLEVSPAVTPSTSVNAHAHALRAQARLQLARNKRSSSDENENSEKNVIAASISDAKRVVQNLSAVASNKSLALAYRTWTDAELFLAEQQQRQEEKETLKKKDFSRVVAVLTEWYRAQPMYRTKLQGEIQGLLLNA